MRIAACVACGLLLCGCSFFEERVTAHDARILELRDKLEALPPDDPERPEIVEELEEEVEARDRALDGVHKEQANRQALLMSLISLGAGGLKIAGGMAAKGVGG